MTTLRADSPAKLNLGLEVIRRREDGFHEIASVFQTITLRDTMELTYPAAGTRLDVYVHGRRAPELEASNLVSTALQRLAQSATVPHGTHVRLHKVIPVAAGLGGASSNAATALRVARRLWDSSATDESLCRIARALGSDVPFFLTGGTALVTGHGEHVEPLPTPADLWFVIVAPRLSRPIPLKTAALYGALRASDFTSGEAVASQAVIIGQALPLDSLLLRNAFERPLLDLRPELHSLISSFKTAGAPFVALSGAGPSHYTIVGT
ncbi:MAG TPA: 4-(cytidine 5'-diphospho)-2-C-methyl-D-erythritol kinase, partial [Thermomicrobiales bacterium]|nr:4-(cytidine 5'-diphospho)-2-C-methyl-D-erythritol kinase [Thermomicrobiales bacterium]